MSSCELRAINGVAPEFVSVSLRSDADQKLISRSIHDVIAEPRRQKLIPEFYRAKRDAMAAGALGFSISGAGPSVFALCEGEEIARRVGAEISRVFTEAPIENQVYVSMVNPHGVHVVD